MTDQMRPFANKLVVVQLLVLFFLSIAIHSACTDDNKRESDKQLEDKASAIGIATEIDTLTGMALDENFELVRANCITCHSAKLITQNRATREGWKGMLDWMRETQNLHDLGENEGPILDYLAKHYSPENKGRRANLEDIEWYELESE